MAKVPKPVEEVNVPLYILAMKVVGILRIRALEFEPQPGVTWIGGRNGQGKSSLLNTCSMVFLGKKYVPADPVNDEAEEGIATIKIGPPGGEPLYYLKFVVQKDRECEIEVTRADGTQVKDARTFLDSIAGPIAFDPFKVGSMDDKQKADLIRRMLGLDFSDLDVARKTAYDKREVCGRVRKTKKGHYDDEMPYFPDAPEEEVNVDELNEMYAGAAEHNNSVDTAIANVARCRDAHQSAWDRVEQLRQEIARAEDARNRAHATLEAAQAARADLGDKMEIDPIMNGVREASEINKKVRANKDRERVYQEWQALDDEWNGYTVEIAALDADRRKRLAENPIPVEGLAFNDEGDTLLLNGHPLETASQAELIRMWCGLGAAFNRDLRVMYIRDASLLDAESQQAVIDFAESHGYQILAEIVNTDEDGLPDLIIEDGMVQS